MMMFRHGLFVQWAIPQLVGGEGPDTLRGRLGFVGRRARSEESKESKGSKDEHEHEHSLVNDGDLDCCSDSLMEALALFG